MENGPREHHKYTLLAVRKIVSIVKEFKDLEKVREIDKSYHDVIIDPIRKGDVENESDFITLGSAFATSIAIKKKEIQGFENPLSYVSEFVRKVLRHMRIQLPLSDEEEKKIKQDENNIEQILEQKIPIKEWSNLANVVIPEIRVSHWERIGEMKGKTESHSLGHVIDEINDEKQNFSIDGDYIGGEYNEYFRKIDKRVRDKEIAPDIIMLDSVKIAEYGAKGVIDGLRHPSVKEKIGDLGEESRLGRTVNHRFAAAPITRNFHLPAFGNLGSSPSDHADKVAEILEGNEGSLKDILEDAYHQGSSSEVHIGKVVRESWETPGELEGRRGRRRCYPFSDYAVEGEQSGQLVTRMMDGEPFIPMQLALGAHTAYTFFAYMAGIPTFTKSQSSLIEVDMKKEYVIRMYNDVKNDRLEYNRAYYFLKTVYLYVPFMSLCLDHTRSGIVRDEKNKLWFDPCLPVEAPYFQRSTSSINFGPRPILANDAQPNSRLSCIGGFCLAISSNSDVKKDASTLSIEIAEQYFKKIKNSDTNENYIQICIDYTKDDSRPDYYHNIENSEIARRPHFEGWPLIQDIISRTVRVYVAALMVYRSIYAEAKKLREDVDDSRENEKKLANKYDEDEFEKLPLEVGGDALNFYLRGCSEEDVSPILTVQRIKNYVESCEDLIVNTFEEKDCEDTGWGEANFAPLRYNASAIYGILSSVLERTGSTPRSSNDVIEIMAHDMMQKMQSRIESLCESKGWTYEKIN